MIRVQFMGSSPLLNLPRQSTNSRSSVPKKARGSRKRQTSAIRTQILFFFFCFRDAIAVQLLCGKKIISVLFKCSMQVEIDLMPWLPNCSFKFNDMIVVVQERTRNRNYAEPRALSWLSSFWSSRRLVLKKL